MGISGGERVAQMRHDRGLTQLNLAGRASISVSLLSKIEVGDRTLTPSTAASIAKGLRITLGALYGEASDPSDAGQVDLAEELRSAVRRYDIPDQSAVVAQGELAAQVSTAFALKDRTDLAGLLQVLPGLLKRATTYAHAHPGPEGWSLLADVYSVIYWLAARFRWMDLVEVAPARQAWATNQCDIPLVSAVAARDRAGTFLNTGDFSGGLAVVDRAIVATDASHLTGQRRAFALGVLHLRGMTLAGRAGDRAESQQHIRAAWRAGEEFPVDWSMHNQIFGMANTATHVLATEGDLGRPREVVRIAEQLFGEDTALPPTRMVDAHIGTARARLDLGDREGAKDSLIDAYEVAPQKARTHPMWGEVLRVSLALSRRADTKLVRLARRAGVPY